MKIKDILQALKTNYVSDLDVLSAEVILTETLNLTKKDLFLKPELEVAEEDIEKFQMALNQLDTGLPLAQIIGKKEFYGRDFLVDENVLIPRPESELVVDLFVAEVANKLAVSFADNKTLKFVDVGTGSGNILLSAIYEIKKKFPDLSLESWGIDISELALNIAKKNAERFLLSDQIVFKANNLFSDLTEEFDVVLANLPYIGTEKFNFVAANTKKYEPSVALFGGPDGLDLYRQMLEQISKWQHKPWLVIGEFGFGQSDEMENILSKVASEYKILDDLAGIPRVFLIKQFK